MHSTRHDLPSMSHLSEEVRFDQHNPTQANLQIVDVLEDMGLLHPSAAI